VIVWLGFVLGILAWVVARQTSAVVTASELEERRNERRVLEGRKAQLLRRISTAESRAILIPRARALGLRPAADSELVILEALPGERR
jgi:hypothetical protein